VLSIGQAREAAKAVLAKVALGEDPQADKAERRSKDRISFKSITGDYLALKRDEVRTKTYAQINRYLAGPHFRPLHNMPIDQVTQRDVAACLVVMMRERGNVTARAGRAQQNPARAPGPPVLRHVTAQHLAARTLAQPQAEPRHVVIEVDHVRLARRQGGCGNGLGVQDHGVTTVGWGGKSSGSSGEALGW
jgi:hypothetical protein